MPMKMRQKVKMMTMKFWSSFQVRIRTSAPIQRASSRQGLRWADLLSIRFLLSGACVCHLRREGGRRRDGSLSPRVLCAGYNHTFGQGGRGDAALIQRMAGELGYRAVILPPVEKDGAPVSSSRIRALLAAGETEAARRLY